jgi:hypothetical protein
VISIRTKVISNGRETILKVKRIQEDYGYPS